MISWKDFANIAIFKTLHLKQNSTLVLERTDGTTTELTPAELASLNDIAAADLTKIDGITDGVGAASKALVLNSAGDVVMPATGMFGFSRAALAALGTTSADAAVIATQVVAVTGSDGTKGVALPAAATTEGPILVINTVLTSGNSLKVYPVDGGNDNINGGAEDAAFVVGEGKSAWFIPTSATQWYVEDASGVTATTTELNLLDGVTATTAELNYVDTTAGTAAASKALITDSNIDVAGVRNFTGLTLLDSTSVETTNLKAKDGTASVTIADSTGVVTSTKKLVFQTATNAGLHGAGASGANHALGATALNGLEYYLNATHTTGDMRGEYLRLYFSGAGGSGEASRIFSTINNVSVATGGTVNGAHISIGTAGASAAVSGAANALRATFGIAAASTNIGGTCSVIQVDTDFDTAVTVPTNFAFLRLTNTNTKKSNNFLRLPNVLGESGGLFCAHVTQTMTHSIRVVSEDGTTYYVMCTNANTNRTES